MQCVKGAFWHKPGDDRTHRETHAVLWVIFRIVLIVLFLIVLATIVVVLCAFHVIGNKREKEQQKTERLFLMQRSNVTFVNAGCDGIVVNMKDHDVR